PGTDQVDQHATTAVAINHMATTDHGNSNANFVHDKSVLHVANDSSEMFDGNLNSKFLEISSKNQSLVNSEEDFHYPEAPDFRYGDPGDGVSPRVAEAIIRMLNTEPDDSNFTLAKFESNLSNLMANLEVDHSYSPKTDSTNSVDLNEDANHSSEYNIDMQIHSADAHVMWNSSLSHSQDIHHHFGDFNS
ncbi:hypothetical protein M0638_27540, partial [Roseomonas sp. NAR14]